MNAVQLVTSRNRHHAASRIVKTPYYSRSPRRARSPAPGGSGSGLARALSKLGFCSRSEAFKLIRAGRVRLNGVVAHDPEQPVRRQSDRIEVDGKAIRAEPHVYVMLNKPRGLVTTASDEKGRDTVYQNLGAAGALPRVFPVGRLDKASEGLLLFTNDTDWAARITDPMAHIEKTYHVQVNCVADDALTQRIEGGVDSEGERLAARRASVLRLGGKNSWLELVLDEGKNRHIRRLLAALDVEVLRLVRVSIGRLELGNLPKGEIRRLLPAEVSALGARTG